MACSRGTLVQAMQPAVRQCSSPSGPRDEALQSSVRARQERSNMRRSGPRTLAQLLVCLKICKLALASVSHEASQPRRAQSPFCAVERLGARLPCRTAALHPTPPAETTRFTAEPLKFKHSICSWRSWRARPVPRKRCSSPQQLHKAAAASSPPGRRAAVE